MRRLLVRVLVAVLLPLTACASSDSDELPTCPKVTGSPVSAPGLVGRIAFRTTGIPTPGFYHCSGIFVMNADGSGLRRITPEPETYPFEARRSPDGRQFVFSGACPDIQHFELCLINEDGSGLRPLSTTSAGHFAPVHDGYPAWSPDGTKIVFSRRQESLRPPEVGEARLLKS